MQHAQVVNLQTLNRTCGSIYRKTCHFVANNHGYTNDILQQLLAFLLHLPTISSEEIAGIAIEDHDLSLLEAIDLGLWLGLTGSRPNRAPWLFLIFGRRYCDLFRVLRRCSRGALRVVYHSCLVAL